MSKIHKDQKTYSNWSLGKLDDRRLTRFSPLFYFNLIKSGRSKSMEIVDGRLVQTLDHKSPEAGEGFNEFVHDSSPSFFGSYFSTIHDHTAWRLE